MDIKTYQEARVMTDQSFDGEFYFGVKTTGIFCRPSCPSPIAKEENVVYFGNVFEALNDGFRPCLRCRPDINVDYYNGNIDGASTVSAALEMIYDGYLIEHSINELASKLFLSDRHLRKLFVENLGVPPIKVAKYHKSIFAKKLLIYSNKSVIEVAFAAGFRSVRQFNDVFKSLFGLTPTAVRRKNSVGAKSSGNMVLRIKHKGIMNFEQILSFMKKRAIRVVETISESSYSRTFRINDASGYFMVTHNPVESVLELNIISDDEA